MENFLKNAQRLALRAELKIERERKYAERIKTILLLDSGQSYTDIAKFLFLDEGTVRNWERRYQEGGIEKLVNDHYVGRSCLLSDDQLEILTNELQSKVYPTTESIVVFVKQDFGIKYTVGGMTSLLHRLGFSYKKPKGVPGKAKAEQQQEFLNRYNGIKPHGPVYFADSTHPMLNPVLASGWIKTGSEFAVKTNSGRQRINVNGAIEINSLNVIARSCKTVNQSSICELLRAIRAKNPKEDKIYLVLDNAAYNRAKSVKRLAKKLSIRLIYLPPYSPNLNPIERLWKFMKKKIMANKHYENLEDFQEAITAFFRGIRKYKPELKTLITDNFRIVSA